MHTKILYLFTRTPLHVGAGASVGAIDQPVQRERHTGFPIIPASSLKGSIADQWNQGLHQEEADQDGKTKRVRVTKSGQISESALLFGSDSDKSAFAGSLIFSEARLLAFPIRSAKGSYAWITCPLMLSRAARDGILLIPLPAEPTDEKALFFTDGPLSIDGKVVLEDYCFDSAGQYPQELADELASCIGDKLFHSIKQRLVILSDGMMSHFATTACDVAQHVRISDETGTAEEGALFNQENVPSDCLFYSVIHATDSRVPKDHEFSDQKADDALARLSEKISSVKVMQFGGDASTGLGFCSVTMQS